MKNVSFVTATAIAAALPLAAMAQGAFDNPTGPYVGAGIGRFNVNIDSVDQVDEVAGSVIDGDDTAMKIFAGWRLLPFLSLEAGYVDLGNPGDDFETSGSDGRYRVGVSGFTVAALGRIPVGPVELIGKIGQYFYDVDTRVEFNGGFPDIRSKNSGNDLFWGGGVGIVLIERLELRAEYERFDIGNAADDSDAFWLSAAWRF